MGAKTTAGLTTTTTTELPSSSPSPPSAPHPPSDILTQYAAAQQERGKEPRGALGKRERSRSNSSGKREHVHLSRAFYVIMSPIHRRRQRKAEQLEEMRAEYSDLNGFLGGACDKREKGCETECEKGENAKAEKGNGDKKESVKREEEENESVPRSCEKEVKDARLDAEEILSGGARPQAIPRAARRDKAARERTVRFRDTIIDIDS